MVSGAKTGIEDKLSSSATYADQQIVLSPAAQLALAMGTSATEQYRREPNSFFRGRMHAGLALLSW